LARNVYEEPEPRFFVDIFSVRTSPMLVQNRAWLRLMWFCRRILLSLVCRIRKLPKTY